MPRPFFQATAEQVVIVSEAIVALGGSDAVAVALYSDLPQPTVEGALKLSADMGLLVETAGQFVSVSPLCKLLRTPQDSEKAAILRVTIESYEPFLIFREELEATADVTIAAQRTKARLDLDLHREQVKETLLNLATYSGALKAGHGNSYERDAKGLSAILDELSAGSREVAEATHTIRVELGPEAASQVDHNQVILPLVAGLRHASAGSGREAVLQAGIAIESFIDWFSNQCAGNIAGATGINAKIDRLVTDSKVPKKLQNVSKYLGHVRNAADHGNDADIGAPWDILPETGRNYVFVAAVFIKTMFGHLAGRHDV